MLSFQPWLICLTSKSAFLCCLLIALVGSPADVSAKWKWKDGSADEVVIQLKGWPTPVDQCRIRIGTPPDFHKENTVFFCPRWVGSDEPRTYFRLIEMMPGWRWGWSYGEEFSELPFFTKTKGNWFAYFRNPVIKPGQKTKCYNDAECYFQRVEFTVKGQECQWISSIPDLKYSTQDRSEAPYGVEIFTCQTSVPITKEHIEMKPGRVTVTFPGGASSSSKYETPNSSKYETPKRGSENKVLINLVAGEKLAEMDLEGVKEFLSRPLLGSNPAGEKYLKDLTKSAIVNTYMSKPFPRSLWGAFPLGCNYRYWGNRSGANDAIEVPSMMCDGQFNKTNLILETPCKCKILAFNRTFFYPAQTYWTKFEPNYVSDNQAKWATELGRLDDIKVCEKAVETQPIGIPRWSADTDRQNHIKIAKIRGLIPEDCSDIISKADDDKKDVVKKSRLIGGPKSIPKKSVPAEKPSSTQRLMDLKKLLEGGLITKEEAAAKRKEILKNL
jgi:hypothetical protein